jgi:polyhydroxybutyrate depolymerase
MTESLCLIDKSSGFARLLGGGPVTAVVLAINTTACKSQVKRVLIAASIVLVASVVAILVFWQRPIAADIYPNEDITVDGKTRNYRLVVPHTLPKPAPIVFAFHGIGDSTESMANYCRLDQLASRNGFILVYLTARKSMWATVNANADNLDANADVRFFDQLLIHLSKHHEIDRDRVYAVGMSNGASFVQLLAVARSNEIAAIAAYSGSKLSNIGSSENPLPIMLVVGANDLASLEMQSDADHYRSDGHVVEFVSVPGLGHEWPTRYNTQMWSFLSQHSLAQKTLTKSGEPGS